MIRVLAIVLAVMASAGPAVAQGEDSRPVDLGSEPQSLDPLWRYPIMLFETAAITVPPTVYYWNTVDQQKEDWELRWDWPSWRGKLFSTQNWVLDTNRFMPNAVRHPLVGAMSYQIGRANGWSPWESVAFAFVTSLVWEDVMEYREDPSVNDMFCNTAGGLFIGEPLFQLGLFGDDDQANAGRRALSWLASPFDRVQRGLGLSWRDHEVVPAGVFSFDLAPSVARLSPSSQRSEFAAGLDVALMRDRAFGEPGHGVTTTGLAGWDRELVELRFGHAPDAESVTGARFRSELTYTARYARDLDEDGHGRAHVLAIAGGFDLDERALARGEWDRLGVFELAGPKLLVFQRTGGLALDAEIAAYGDVAMVEAHMWTQPPETARSVLLDRGYYYATGLSQIARVRVRGTRWSAGLDATAHEFWSFDDHSQGGTMDPKGVADQRLIGSAHVGFRPGGGPFELTLFGDAIWRRGSWQQMERADTELDAGLGMGIAF